MRFFKKFRGELSGALAFSHHAAVLCRLQVARHALQSPNLADEGGL